MSVGREQQYVVKKPGKVKGPFVYCSAGKGRHTVVRPMSYVHEVQVQTSRGVVGLASSSPCTASIALWCAFHFCPSARLAWLQQQQQQQQEPKLNHLKQSQHQTAMHLQEHHALQQQTHTPEYIESLKQEQFSMYPTTTAAGGVDSHPYIASPTEAYMTPQSQAGSIWGTPARTLSDDFDNTSDVMATATAPVNSTTNYALHGSPTSVSAAAAAAVNVVSGFSSHLSSPRTNSAWVHHHGQQPAVGTGAPSPGPYHSSSWDTPSSISRTGAGGGGAGGGVGYAATTGGYATLRGDERDNRLSYHHSSFPSAAAAAATAAAAGTSGGLYTTTPQPFDSGNMGIMASSHSHGQQQPTGGHGCYPETHIRTDLLAYNVDDDPGFGGHHHQHTSQYPHPGHASFHRRHHTGPGSMVSSPGEDIKLDLDYLDSLDIDMDVPLNGQPHRRVVGNSGPATTTTGDGDHDNTNRNRSTGGGGSGSGSGSANGSGDLPYAQLIYQAFMSSERKAMTLQEIYQWFRENTARGRGTSKGWQNSIRHNLSMNGAFLRRDRTYTTPLDADETRDPTAVPTDIQLSGPSDDTNTTDSQRPAATAEWYLSDEAIKKGVLSTTRFRKDKEQRRSTVHHTRQSSSHRSSSFSGGTNSRFRKKTKRESPTAQRGHTTTTATTDNTTAADLDIHHYLAAQQQVLHHTNGGNGTSGGSGIGMSLYNAPPPPPHHPTTTTQSAYYATTSPYSPYTHAMVRTQSLDLSESGLDEPLTPADHQTTFHVTSPNLHHDCLSSPCEPGTAGGGGGGHGHGHGYHHPYNAEGGVGGGLAGVVGVGVGGGVLGGTSGDLYGHGLPSSASASASSSSAYLHQQHQHQQGTHGQGHGHGQQHARY
ncbi:hypothetical protein QBC47DRAFT_363429 [Echria macrotheca]|uniref:Fork-head domain-containing protein n=1 Tax=Echria macrotheca TaxID=438768 RepID=A0AAJ0B6Z8_9PEZI|nr:hypothetical protein QBC47DRAFT_363429 [Echria macrotheca]